MKLRASFYQIFPNTDGINISYIMYDVIICSISVCYYSSRAALFETKFIIPYCIPIFLFMSHDSEEFELG